MRMVRIDQSGRDIPAVGRGHERLQLVELERRYGQAGVLVDVFAGAEEEHPVANDRPPDRPAPLLTAVGNLLEVVLLREVVLRGQRPVTAIDKPRAVKR